ncbi:MAG: iron chelate uptake ABC transporter family permease subunit, partial [Gemmatimonadetes bacterium]|nr:iron ABC transporter permease [Gemmatimonadota bacterium]NIR77299.1 iron ABC transporter permease [Gemmatimonadota bacterium]NIT85820.1 iron ABC transporter permease [Gemmatimonadota bacterium]NIU29643.1 iron ABC transporter permease [Gemmatimonadota bacterium]NIU34690.1 iron chelate uptake ABC transporter family permease subunit [Gemmatimonadota bacterium]
MRGTDAARLGGLLGLLFLAMGASTVTGTAGIPLRDVLRTLSADTDPTVRAIILELRLPRALLAALVGGALAVCGAVFQAILRNPLAEPYVLGISGGAAVGAVMAVILGWSARSGWAVPVAAFAGAVAAMILVLRITLAVGSGLRSRVLILAGVVVGAFFNALILLALTFADVESFRSAVFWMMGNLQGASWSSVLLLSAYLVPAAAVLLALGRPLNLLAVGEDTALFLGTRVGRVKLVAYLTTS